MGFIIAKTISDYAGVSYTVKCIIEDSSIVQWANKTITTTKDTFSNILTNIKDNLVLPNQYSDDNCEQAIDNYNER